MLCTESVRTSFIIPERTGETPLQENILRQNEENLTQGNSVRYVRIAPVILAVHLIVLAFFFFKPRLNYFVLVCLSTMFVWSLVFAFGKWRLKTAIVIGWLIQIGIQQFAYHSWLRDQAGLWWPLLQFNALQYLIVLRLNSPPEHA